MKTVAVLDDDAIVRSLIKLGDDQAPAQEQIELADGAQVVPGEHRWDGSQFVAIAFVAVLDGGIYRGVERIDLADLQPDQVRVPEDCDLRPGAYAWDGKTFTPIKAADPLSDAPPPAVLPAIALGFIAIWKAGAVVLPEETLAWLDAYVVTIDFKGRLAVAGIARDYAQARGLK